MLEPAFAHLARDAPYLAAEEERALILRAQAGDEKARDHLFRAHYRLVIQEATKRKGYSVPAADLFQEGVTGMADALVRFDPKQDVRFNTYARWWIKSAMNDAALRDHSVVRRNTTSRDKSLFFGLRKARAFLERGRRLSDVEINERLAAHFGTTVAEIVSMTAYLASGDKALNAPIGSEGGEAVDFLVDEAPAPDEIAECGLDRERFGEILCRVISQLDAREQKIILGRRYVKDPDDEMTLEDLSTVLGISRERVRQIEQRALEKMRSLLEAEGIGPGDI